MCCQALQLSHSKASWRGRTSVAQTTHGKRISAPVLLILNNLDVSSMLPELQMTDICIKTVVHFKLLIDKLPVSKQLDILYQLRLRKQLFSKQFLTTSKQVVHCYNVEYQLALKWCIGTITNWCIKTESGALGPSKWCIGTSSMVH